MFIFIDEVISCITPDIVIVFFCIFSDVYWEGRTLWLLLRYNLFLVIAYKTLANRAFS